MFSKYYSEEEIKNMDEEETNRAIKYISIKIEMNEKFQDSFIIMNGGDQGENLYRQHDDLCDTMDLLTEHRRSFKPAFA